MSMRNLTEPNERKPAIISKPPIIVYIGLIGSVTSLFFGLLIGISALAGNNGYANNTSLSSDIMFHPDIMIFGVLGGLLITEKLASMEGFRIFNRFRISRVTILSLYTGVVLTSLGIIYDNYYFRYFGLGLVVTAALLFFHYVTSPKSHGQTGIRWVFGAAVAAIVLTALTNSEVNIPLSVQLTYLGLLFPIIYILAERIELGFVRGMKKGIVLLESVLAWLAVISGFISSTFQYHPISYLAMYSSIFFLSLMILISVRYDPAFHRTKKRGRFEIFMKTGIVVAYFWLILGIILFTLQAEGIPGLLDPATHAIALGFVGTFIVTHSPIIFPLVLRKNAVEERVTLLPLLVITVANAMRVFGDLTSRIYSSWNSISYLSVYVLIIAIFAFVYNLVRVTKSRPI